MVQRKKMVDFLFELGIEEVPASEIKNIVFQLKDNFQTKLAETLVKFKSIEISATNRRFMIYISEVSKKADDKEEQILGPSKKISIDENGQPTIALKKFMEFNNVELSDIVEIETKKGLYLCIHKVTEGPKTYDILCKIIPEILGKLAFSKTMLWNESRVPFIRPIRNILCLLNNQLIELKFAGIKPSKFINGHTTLSESLIEISSFKDYIEQLTKNFVIVKEKEREEKIINEITEIENELDVDVKIDDEMLNYYIYNNEYPVVFTGNFNKKYLELPSEIISTFMIKEKKLLPVYDKNNNLLNTFVGVSSIPDENHFVSNGNEKVIQATFEDAKFFWDNDLKDNFINLRENLKKVKFQNDLGTFFDKTERLNYLIEFLVKETNNNHMYENIKQASCLCKNDLVTRMVREFPSLQGIMGGLYLKEMNSEEDLWKSVYGHYEPKGFTDKKLDHIGAGILSIADKIDNIAGFVSKDIKVSSSKDPYGIRRDANAIIKVIIDFKMNFDLYKLIKLAAEKFTENEEDQKKLVSQLQKLFLSRIENIFRDLLNFRYDVVNSIINSHDILFVYKSFLKAKDVSKIVETDSINLLITLHKRLKNIIKGFNTFFISEDLLMGDEEKILFEIYKESKTEITELIFSGNYIQVCSKFIEMKPVIDNYFEKVLIMAEDDKIKENRIALLQKLDELLSKITDFSLIIESN
jgi:glycyl-tRNA synthetase beta chain